MRATVNSSTIRMSEYTPKDIRGIGVNPETTKRNRRIREKRVRDAERDLRAEEESLKRFSTGGFKNQFYREVAQAKLRFAEFVDRTDRNIDLETNVYRMSLKKQNVLEVIEEEYPLKGRTWLNLTPGRGHRPALSQSQLRHLCSVLQIRYWREMKTDEMRAVLLLFVWKSKIDPEKYFWNEGDLD